MGGSRCLALPLQIQPASCGNALSNRSFNRSLNRSRRLRMQNKSHVCLFALACTFLGAQAALAGDDPARPATATTITWDDFKYRCSDAKDKPLNEQGKPEHVRLQCTNVEREFV